MFNFTPPIWKNVANDGIGCSNKSCNVSGGAHFCARRLFLFLIVLILVVAFVSGFRAGRRAAHEGQVWVDNIPTLYMPIFYNASALDYYIERAYNDSTNYEAMTIAATAAYNLRLFDKRAFDTLPAIPLDDADMMLLCAAWHDHAPAHLIIHFLDQMDIWAHSLPDGAPSEYNFGGIPGDPDYTQMIVK